MPRDTDARMKKAIEATLHEFNTVRTGRASPALLEGIVVEYYGAKTPLNQLATITAPEARMLVVQAWDKGAVKDIQKAITMSNLGLNPSADGNNLRITVPELTEERRKDLAKVVRQTAEDGRVSIRGIRRDAIDDLRKQEKAGDISEDESRREQGAVQKTTDEFIKQVDELLAAKEEELMTL
jgi:ribosome recycling factor